MPADSHITSVGTLRCGNMVAAMRVPDSMSSAAMMTVATTFSQPRLTQGPRTSRSLHSSRRNTLALGSSRPARAWTASVTTPSGAPGISTIPAAAATRAVKDR